VFAAAALAIVPRSSRAAAATAANNSYRVSEPQNLLEMSEGQLQDIVWRGEKEVSCNEKQINVRPVEICISVSFMYSCIRRLCQIARPNNQPESGSWACLSV